MTRVAAYCRVSTDREDQANSFEAQQRYFRAYIEGHPDWELHGVYADEGISGTSTRKRAAFNRMIADAAGGCFSLIITKEVSRFSRNILDTIQYTRALKEQGVGVIFLNDGIHTLDPDAELRLSIMGSIAQEESRKTSDRVKWGQTRQMERGVVFGHSMLGYDVRNGKMTVDPAGAELAALIFHKYAQEQMGTARIARYLNEHGYRTASGRNWTASGIIKILRNDKYVGDLTQKKSYTPDFLDHGKKQNRGQVPLVVIRDHHEPIISRELWAMTQRRLDRNNKHGDGNAGHSNRYIFSGRIKCAQCGASFVGRSRTLKDGTKRRRWCCGTAVHEGASVCDVGKLVRDDDAVHMMQTALASLPADREQLAAELARIADRAIRASGEDAAASAQRLRAEMDRIQKKRERLLDMYLEGDIPRDDMLAMKGSFDQQLDALRARLDAGAAAVGPDSAEGLRQEILALLSGQRVSEALYKHLLNSLRVYRDKHMELRLNGLPQVFHFR